MMQRGCEIPIYACGVICTFYYLVHTHYMYPRHILYVVVGILYYYTICSES